MTLAPPEIKSVVRQSRKPVASRPTKSLSQNEPDEAFDPLHLAFGAAAVGLACFGIAAVRRRPKPALKEESFDAVAPAVANDRDAAVVAVHSPASEAAREGPDAAMDALMASMDSRMIEKLRADRRIEYFEC